MAAAAELYERLCCERYMSPLRTVVRRLARLRVGEVRVFQLTALTLSDSMCHVLSSVVDCLPELRCLDMDYATLSPTGLGVLCRSVARHPCVVAVTLRGVVCGYPALKVLRQMLEQNEFVSVLDVSSLSVACGEAPEKEYKRIEKLIEERSQLEILKDCDRVHTMMNGNGELSTSCLSMDVAYWDRNPPILQEEEMLEARIAAQLQRLDAMSSAFHPIICVERGLIEEYRSIGEAALLEVSLMFAARWEEYHAKSAACQGNVRVTPLSSEKEAAILSARAKALISSIGATWDRLRSLRSTPL